MNCTLIAQSLHNQADRPEIVSAPSHAHLQGTHTLLHWTHTLSSTHQDEGPNETKNTVLRQALNNIQT